MRNIAKCRLCHTIIESFHSTDYVSCKCGEISVDGGEAMRCSSMNWINFLRVDDEGNEIIVKVTESAQQKPTDAPPKSKEDIIHELARYVVHLEDLPKEAQNLPISHYDFSAALSLVLAALLAD